MLDDEIRRIAREVVREEVARLQADRPDAPLTAGPGQAGACAALGGRRNAGRAARAARRAAGHRLVAGVVAARLDELLDLLQPPARWATMCPSRTRRPSA